ncbi:hypothetical protein SNE25_20330 [Mucilaginibacter sabulilitoris]|uniref:Uncharacterized protein n=1 Tax=Mucilaginibacter sabulilitoris TaxID=1173583 RepID=A0ABZ0TIX7_9SPHI|nr:hypothetical protein [Mucilaginibacter sabulilitoris]WPU91669.1 hypothetical protein SNE25_20330 [Mucilaginibacter sabulilitoris]
MIRLFFDWSEVWALFIPLFVWVFHKKQPSFLNSVVVYLWLALALNLFGDIIGDFRTPFHFPLYLQSNNPVYNIHSVVRFVCFSCFFLSIQRHQFKKLKNIIIGTFILFLIIDFVFFEHFFLPDHLSGNLFSAEAYLLLIFCMLYYLTVLNAEEETAFKSPDFWVVTGLSIYVVVNFFVFLFYVPMITQNPDLANNIWDIHNVSYIILCLFITRGFYVISEKYAVVGN